MKKSIISIGLALVLFLCNSIPVQAAHASSYAWVDENGDIIFQVYDKKRTGAKAYQTVGISITRCIKGTKIVSPAYETVAIALNTSLAEVVEDGNSLSTLFRFPESELLSRIATFYGDTDWLADLQCDDEQPVWLLLNSIMVCVEYDQDGVAHYQGYYWDDGSRLGYWMDNVYADVTECQCMRCGGSVPSLIDGFVYVKDYTQSELICYGTECLSHNKGGS